ncbi:MAG: PAS domain-containing protein, partial [bacterium]
MKIPSKNHRPSGRDSYLAARDQKRTDLYLRRQLSRKTKQLQRKERELAAAVRKYTDSVGETRAEKDKFETWFRYNPNAVHIVDDKGIILDVNIAWCEIFRASREDVVG